MTSVKVLTRPAKSIKMAPMRTGRYELSVDRKGVPDLQSGGVFHGISYCDHLPDCKSGTPLAIFYETFRSTDYT